MRLKFSRAFLMALLYVFAHLYLPSCSSTEEQVDDEDLEVSDDQSANNEEAYQDDDQQAAANNNDENAINDESANNAADDENVVADNNAADNNVVDENYAEGASQNGASDNNEVLDGQQTNQDLQEIISNNGQQPNAGNAPVANAANAGTPTNVASGVSAGPALPEMGSKMPYIVQSGDTLASIATKIYGSQDKWNEIANLSSLANPNKVYPGDVIYYQLNQETLAFATSYEGLARTEITVQQGDTLSSLAAQNTGSWANWKIFWRLTDGITNPDKLEPGQVVYFINAANLSASNMKKTYKIGEYFDFDQNNSTQSSQLSDNSPSNSGFMFAQSLAHAISAMAHCASIG